MNCKNSNKDLSEKELALLSQAISLPEGITIPCDWNIAENLFNREPKLLTIDHLSGDRLRWTITDAGRAAFWRNFAYRLAIELKGQLDIEFDHGIDAEADKLLDEAYSIGLLKC